MIKRSATDAGKGWFAGPWDGPLPIALGYAGRGVDEPHVHDEMFEIYLVARGSSVATVDGRRVELMAGDALVVEPGESHTFVSSTDDYLHFVVPAPFVDGHKRAAKPVAPRGDS